MHGWPGQNRIDGECEGSCVAVQDVQALVGSRDDILGGVDYDRADPGADGTILLGVKVNRGAVLVPL